MLKAQALAKEIRERNAATRIQKIWRGYVVRKWYKQTSRRMVLIQTCVRRRKAAKAYKLLKAEARSVGKLKETNFKLESKVVELSQALKDSKEESARLGEKVTSLEAQVAQWKEKFSKVETANKAATADASHGSAELKKELHDLQLAKESLAKENEKGLAMLKKRDDAVARLEAELAAVREEAAKLKEEVQKAPKVVQQTVEDTATVNALKKEVANLREQLSRALAGKYRTDRVADAAIAESRSSISSDYHPYPNGIVTSPSSGYLNGYMGDRPIPSMSTQIEMDMAAHAAKNKPRRHSYVEGAPASPVDRAVSHRKSRANIAIDTRAPIPIHDEGQVLETEVSGNATTSLPRNLTILTPYLSALRSCSRR